MKRNIGATMKQIYGTGNFNPRRFDRKPNKSRFRVYLWGFSIFLFASIAVILGGLYLFGSTPDSFTGERVYFELIGSKNPKTAQVEDYTLKIINNEEVALEDLELFIDWSGAHFISSVINPTSEANNTWKLGEIGIGEILNFNFQVRFVGQTSAEISLPFSLTLKPKGFNSAFVLDHEELFELGDPTIDIAINGPSVASLNSSIGFDILILGDSLGFGDVSKLIVKIDAPSSFNLTSSQPELDDSDELEWILAELPRHNDAYKIHIAGDLSADAGEENIFIAQLSRAGESKILVSAEKAVTIQSADASIDISASPAQGKKLQWAERVDYVLKVKNTSEYVMRDVVITANAPDDALWQSSSLNIGSNGFFESSKFIWDASTTDALSSIRSGASVDLKFSFNTKETPPKAFEGSPTLSVQASVKAQLGDNELSIQSAESKINILAGLDFDISAWYTSPEHITVGSGPRFPQSGQESIYEVSFKFGPTTSDLKDIKLTFDASNVVELKNESSYSVGELSFNDKVITWRASKIPALELPIEVRFKIGVIPVSSLSSSAALLDNIKLIVVDAKADEMMEFFGGNITVGDIE
ncbi:hypothetical protein KKF64_02050 [Patescibacteria group bacterium]|nr:hypothetical protein [Patescibacteria group bacterium]